MHQHTSVPYCSVPLGSFYSELDDMYSYEKDEYDDLQRIRTCVCVCVCVSIYIYIYIYIYMNLINMKMVKCNYLK